MNFFHNIQYIPITNTYTLYFFLFSTLIITISSIYQNQFLYKDIKETLISNKKRIITQINILLTSQQFLIPIYALTFSTTIITIIKNAFDIGIQQNYLLEITLIFLYLSLIIEYHFFMLPVAIKAEELSISIEDELIVRETFIQRHKHEVNQNLKEIVNALIDSEKFNDESYAKISIILKELNNNSYSIKEIKILLEKQKPILKKNGIDRLKNSFIIRDDNFNIYELYIENDELILNYLIPSNSMAFEHFYKPIDINNTLIKGMFEGIVVSLILYMSLTFKF